MEDGREVTFQIISDVHIEKEYPKEVLITDVADVSSDTLILAGDIGQLKYRDQLEIFLKSCCDSYERVIYVPGNHEYDDMDYTAANEILESFQEIFDNMEVFIDSTKQIRIGDVVVIGGTFWSCIPDTAEQINPIFHEGEQMSSAMYNYLHHKTKFNIESQIKEIRRTDEFYSVKRKVLVITHYPPTFKRTILGYGNKPSYYYCSNNDSLLKSEKVDCWVAGHTHLKFEFKTQGGTFVVSNPYRGKRYFRKHVISL